MALHGAQQVVGIDIIEDRIAFANSKLRKEYSSLTHKVDFKLVTNPKQLEGKKFDLILSKDSFEHIENPEKYIKELQKYLADNGRVVIGFGPLWKSPYGGHIDYMTGFPWAHLLFPEKIIMKERKRFRPDEDAEKFEQVKGGLNKMTLKKFKRIMKNSGLYLHYIKTNVHDRKLARIFHIFSHLPFCEEYFTFNLYSIWCLED
jgi:SAM-dependent methyltransferase